jgi:hypothetical protein
MEEQNGGQLFQQALLADDGLYAYLREHCAFLGRGLRGVEYGGGALARAASQSNGMDDDIEGVSAGDR